MLPNNIYKIPMSVAPPLIENGNPYYLNGSGLHSVMSPVQPVQQSNLQVVAAPLLSAPYLFADGETNPTSPGITNGVDGNKKMPKAESENNLVDKFKELKKLSPKGASISASETKTTQSNYDDVIEQQEDNKQAMINYQEELNKWNQDPGTESEYAKSVNDQYKNIPTYIDYRQMQKDYLSDNDEAERITKARLAAGLITKDEYEADAEKNLGELQQKRMQSAPPIPKYINTPMGYRDTATGAYDTGVPASRGPKPEKPMLYDIPYVDEKSTEHISINPDNQRPAKVIKPYAKQYPSFDDNKNLQMSTATSPRDFSEIDMNNFVGRTQLTSAQKILEGATDSLYDKKVDWIITDWNTGKDVKLPETTLDAAIAKDLSHIGIQERNAGRPSYLSFITYKHKGNQNDLKNYDVPYEVAVIDPKKFFEAIPLEKAIVYTTNTKTGEKEPQLSDAATLLINRIAAAGQERINMLIEKNKPSYYKALSQQEKDNVTHSGEAINLSQNKFLHKSRFVLTLKAEILKYLESITNK